MKRRELLLATAGLLPAFKAWAAYPDRPVRVIVPYAAGGGPDVFMRQMGVPLGEKLGQAIVVENKVGAAGVLAAQYVASAQPDGYTLLQGSNSHLVQKLLQPSLRFDPLKDFVFIGNLSGAPSILTVAADSPFQSVDDIVKAARAEPGKLNYASGGIGTGAHLAGATLMAIHKLKAVHVPLRGSVEITGSLLRGDTQFAFPTAGTAMPQIKAGKLRALAVTTDKRLTELPDVPTLLELTKNPLTVQVSWSGLWAPAKTPKSVIDHVFAAIGPMLDSPELRASAVSMGSQLLPSASPAEYARFVQAENAKWAKVVQLASEADKA